jgi:hypothetical protein
MTDDELEKVKAFIEDEGYDEAKAFIKDFNRMRDALKSVYKDIRRIDNETGVLGLD